MKILKYLLGIIAIFLIGFILVGVFKPTVSYGSELEVNKPAKEVWAVMNDESKMHLWLIGYKGSKLISGIEGDVGAVSQIVMIPEGSEEEMVMTEMITTSKENEHMGMAFDADIMSSTLDMYFTEKDGKTMMRSEAVATGKGMIMKSIFAVMESSMAKEDLQIMTNLKKVIEENTTDYFPQPKIEANEMEDVAIENDASKG
jgi:hypothetical protein